jgi:hypothetical protein
MKSVRTNALYVILLLLLAVFLITMLLNNNDSLPVVDIGRVAQMATDGEVQKITVAGEELTVDLRDGRSVQSRKEDSGSVVETLRNLGVPESAFGSGSNKIEIVVQAPSWWVNIAPS